MQNGLLGFLPVIATHFLLYKPPRRDAGATESEEPALRKSLENRAL